MKAREGVALALLLLGCERRPELTPEGALMTWVNAMNASRSDASQRRAAFDLLAPAARRNLAARAARASQFAGRPVEPWEMLAPGRFSLRFSIDPANLRVELQGDRATVQANGPGGDHADVPMVREGNAWRVDLALPPPAQGTPPDAGR